jgi:hypothetical protein
MISQGSPRCPHLCSSLTCSSLQELALENPLGASERTDTYLHGLFLAGLLRFYVGQATVLCNRIKGHTKADRDTLHHQVTR